MTPPLGRLCSLACQFEVAGGIRAVYRFRLAVDYDGLFGYAVAPDLIAESRHDESGDYGNRGGKNSVVESEPAGCGKGRDDQRSRRSFRGNATAGEPESAEDGGGHSWREDAPEVGAAKEL